MELVLDLMEDDSCPGLKRIEHRCYERNVDTNAIARSLEAQLPRPIRYCVVDEFSCLRPSWKESLQCRPYIRGYSVHVGEESSYKIDTYV